MKYFFLIKDGSFEGFLNGLRYILLAAAFGHEVSVHFVGWAAARLRKDRLNEIELPEEFLAEEARYLAQIRTVGVTDLRQYFQLLRQAGVSRITVCSLAATIHQLQSEDLIPEIDGVAGSSTIFLEELDKADKVIVW